MVRRFVFEVLGPVDVFVKELEGLGLKVMVEDNGGCCVVRAWGVFEGWDDYSVAVESVFVLGDRFGRLSSYRLGCL